MKLRPIAFIPRPPSALLLLPLAPWTLHRAAAATPFLLAVILGPLTTALVLGIVIAGASAGISEPFLDLADYFSAAAFGALTFGAILAIPSVVLVAPLLAASRQLPRHTSRQSAGVCAVLLTPPTLILPALAWSFAAALQYAQDPSFGLMSGKPAWLLSAWIPAFASGHWLWLGLLAAAFNTAAARRRIRHAAFPDDGTICEHCGYSLSGLPPGGACPECGKGVAA